MNTIPLSDCNIRIGGEAGQGMQTIGAVLGKTFARSGWEVFGSQDVESRIRGGHSFINVRVGAKRKRGVADYVDILVALNKETISIHRDKIRNNGFILIDPGDETPTPSENEIPIPLGKLARDEGGNKLMINTVASGAILALLGFELQEFEKIMAEEFGSKGQEVVDGNIRAAKAGSEYIKQHAGHGFTLDGIAHEKGLPVISGNHAIAMGALAAGCRFMSAYPMSPSTSIMEFLSTTSDQTGFVVEQAEDEICAMNMAIGASFAGARALVATSGGGFSLMVEALGLAGMTETSVVVIDGQRPGPATGLPTRTEQGDLLFVMHAAQGEFPRAILTPGSPEEAFHAAVHAFNLADKYQTPIIILSDEHLATSFFTCEPFDFNNVKIDHGELITDKISAGENYVRYKVTDSGVSPRVIPGTKDVLVKADSDEHVEEGVITESAEVRTAQVNKRMRKMKGLENEILPPEKYGPDDAAAVLIGWGSTRGAIREAVDILNTGGTKIRSIHFPQLWPFPHDSFISLLNNAPKWIVIEGNATGQLSRLIRMETGLQSTTKFLKFDGRQWMPSEIVAKFKEEGK
jgi:2-oxoglutarate/2-oxoacid ferredoxin oxidoreductase subunit alpha